jgi:uncharacterized protein (TIGR03437 family)
MARCLAVVLASSAVFAAVPQPLPSLPLAFEPNVGQTDRQVKFLAHARHATLWLTEREAVYGSLRLRFEGGRANPKIEAEDKRRGVSNYFTGNDRSHWHTDVPQFGKVRYRDVYPGIDVVFYGNPSNLEYDFMLQPGADPSRIRLAFDGIDSMRVDANGDLVLKPGDAEFRSLQPAILQNSEPVSGHWTILGRRRAGFVIDGYDRTQRLVIDPVLTYSTFLGGSDYDEIDGIAIDPQGNLIVAGASQSTDFPTTAASLSPLYPDGSAKNPGSYPVVTKINPAASGANSVVFSTYFNTGVGVKPPSGFGVDGADLAGVAVDSTGNIYIAGEAFDGLPLMNQIQAYALNNIDCTYTRVKTGQILPGVSCPDAYVTEFSGAGNQILFSTYLGGSESEEANAITVDAAGNIYLGGYTNSPNFPLAGNSLPFVAPALTGAQTGQAAWVAKISAGKSLVYSTYFGAASPTSLLTVDGLAADAKGQIYITGFTNTGGLPVTPGALQPALPPAGFNAYVAILNPALPAPQSSVSYCTYLGGNFGTEGNAIAVDSSGNIYVVGDTKATNFPVTTTAISLEGGGLNTHPFVTKLNPSATGQAQLLFSTMLRGSGPDAPGSVAVNSQGQILVAGDTNSVDFPVTNDAFEPLSAGALDSNGNLLNNMGFLAWLDPSRLGAAALLYSTYIGGTDQTDVLGLAIDGAGRTVAVAGGTYAANTPVTASGAQSVLAGDQDGFLMRFDLTQTSPVLLSYANGASLAADLNETLSPGLIFTIKGTNLGPTAPAFGALDSNGRVSSEIAGVQVLVNNYPCPLLYVSATQINAIAPYEIASAVGDFASIEVINNGVPGTVWFVGVAPTNPGIFSFDNGKGQAAVLNQDNSVNGAANPAARGSIIQIFATGEGQTMPPGVDGAIANGSVIPVPAATNTSITIGGVAATSIGYAGTLPGGVAGAFQIDATIPASAPTGSAVPIVFSIGGASSQKGLTIAVK